VANSNPLEDQQTLAALSAIKAEVAAGNSEKADQMLVRLAQSAPHHPAVLNELGLKMLNRGAPDQALLLFERATQADPNHPSLWSNLASAYNAMGRRAEEIDAIERALRIDPRHISSLLQKGAYLEVGGDVGNAARLYTHLLSILPPALADNPSIREAVQHARKVVQQDQNVLLAKLEQPLAEIRSRHGGRAQRRVNRCLDILMGKRTTYYSQPTWMYMPELPAIEFFEREDTPWLAAFEAQTAEMRSEFLRVFSTDREGLQPYLDFSDDLPLDQFKELNRSRRWSAYFLWNRGNELVSHTAACPTTAKLLQTAPRCIVDRRSPNAFFSILDAKTTIPAHVGVTNTRCTVHVPLVIPPGCEFRVGSTTREWKVGEAWVFDDTIEHEAWNNSDTPRAILLFDIWNPLLTIPEREMIGKATEIYAEHYAISSEVEL
jgi:aspartate beta-hydroxylase